MQPATSEAFLHYMQQQRYPDTIFVIGGGPSLKNVNFSLFTPEHFVIVCNQAFELMPHARIAHHCDHKWWRDYRTSLAENFKGEFITGCGLGCNLEEDGSVLRVGLRNQNSQLGEEIFYPTDDIYVYGGNSGLQALSLAHLFAPKNIVLIGFDFQAKDGKSHGYAKKDQQAVDSYLRFWKMFVKDFNRFEKLRRDVWRADNPLPEIWNVNPDSALTLYDRSRKLADFL
ncbi:hypothetical protein J2T38_000076 [Neisseria perflava]|uniref:hypothetical protein n=1 Tax=Neisseria perflava TaxID=33053 RepID=UPI0020A1EA99|nr:hypothetical protein [Neisseria perflava]MCP1771287.1 hypothetical protein [Neisseria perflava]